MRAPSVKRLHGKKLVYFYGILSATVRTPLQTLNDQSHQTRFALLARASGQSR
jgi:hypothetical protein